MLCASAFLHARRMETFSACARKCWLMCCLFLLGCVTTRPPQLNMQLAATLMQLAERDKEAREGALSAPFNTNLRGTIQRIDRENREELRAIIKRFGWPGRSLVGEPAAHAAWLIAQHADEDLPFQKDCLKLMESAPDGEVSRHDLAFLTDRVLLASGKKQLYGTQFAQVGRGFLPQPMDDAKKVEARRRKIGLPPLAQYARELQGLYISPGGSR